MNSTSVKPLWILLLGAITAGVAAFHAVAESVGPLAPSLPSTGAPPARRDRTASAFPVAAACVKAGDAGVAVSAAAVAPDVAPCRKESAVRRKDEPTFANSRTRIA
jgi:hypothetical protein